MKKSELNLTEVFVNDKHQVKSVIIDMDARFMKHSGATVKGLPIYRTDAKGRTRKRASVGGYLVLRAPMYFPDELLLENAEVLRKSYGNVILDPQTGTWPFPIFQNRFHKSPGMFYKGAAPEGMIPFTRTESRSVYPQASIWSSAEFSRTRADQLRLKEEHRLRHEQYKRERDEKLAKMNTMLDKVIADANETLKLPPTSENNYDPVGIRRIYRDGIPSVGISISALTELSRLAKIGAAHEETNR